jgi:hypothetical protein
MPIPEELRQELLKEFEKHLEEVRKCPMTPGSLEPILTRAARRMARLTQETLAQAASKEADFPPSGVPVLQGRAPVQPESETEGAGDGVGSDLL